MPFGQEDNDDGDWGTSDEGGEWSTDEGEGLFNEPNTQNPLMTREHDARMHAPPAQARGSVEKQPVALVAQFGPDGQPVVARTIMKGGKPRQLEEWRRPTPDEYNAIMFGGKIVRGGVVAENVPTTTNLNNNLQATPLGAAGGGKVKKVLVWGGIAAALAGTGYGIYRWRKGKK